MNGQLFAGADYKPKHDDARLTGQLNRVRELMKDGKWRSLTAIALRTGDPAASVSAQLRHLRKPKFGGYLVERRSTGDRMRGLYEYRLEHLPGISTARTRIGTVKALRARIAELEAQVERLEGLVRA